MSRLLSYACAATLFAGLIATAGCGGGGGEGALGASGQLRGTTAQSSASAPNVVTVVPVAGGQALTLQVKDAVTGAVTTQTVVIPSTPVFANVPANSPLAVINLGSTLLGGTFTGGVGISGDLASSIASISTSGISLSNIGSLLQNLALPIDPVAGTRLTITLPQGNVKTRDLTVKNTSVTGRFYVDNSGGSITIVSPIPTSINGVIPNNGENAAGAFQTCIFGPGNLGRSATLDIVYGNGFELHQSRNIQPDSANGNALTAKFTNLTLDTSNVPAGGVDSISLTIGDR
ncbi:MAG: hypothetical protein NT023_07250 [Armatimonadetes bacterium]|nr:hypothetical protein [Armatimonadota bacterium]